MRSERRANWAIGKGRRALQCSRQPLRGARLQGITLSAICAGERLEDFRRVVKAASEGASSVMPSVERGKRLLLGVASNALMALLMMLSPGMLPSDCAKSVAHCAWAAQPVAV